ncbi:transcriptional repressor [Actinomadura rudentiformis]|uniref:Transcriptional repressor n=1 Tax=Actinomadura rudentiformis TaxID=359158 RepID=A0A6H9YSM2_9ACTN|nr:transcriptional repressor [Actinomadura rudentiformis]KAB2349700.1 hypothetical protein F8566_13180 [Actinomadura rudentiformis]
MAAMVTGACARSGPGTLPVRCGERLYRPRPADGHRHYLICRSCSRSRPVDSEAVEAWADHVAKATGFAAVEHTVELAGICAACRPAGHEEGSSCR